MPLINDYNNSNCVTSGLTRSPLTSLLPSTCVMCRSHSDLAADLIEHHRRTNADVTIATHHPTASEQQVQRGVCLTYG